MRVPAVANTTATTKEFDLRAELLSRLQLPQSADSQSRSAESLSQSADSLSQSADSLSQSADLLCHPSPKAAVKTSGSLHLLHRFPPFQELENHLDEESMSQHFPPSHDKSCQRGEIARRSDYCLTVGEVVNLRCLGDYENIEDLIQEGASAPQRQEEQGEEGETLCLLPTLRIEEREEQGVPQEQGGWQGVPQEHGTWQGVPQEQGVWQGVPQEQGVWQGVPQEQGGWQGVPQEQKLWQGVPQEPGDEDGWGSVRTRDSLRFKRSKSEREWKLGIWEAREGRLHSHRPIHRLIILES
jgi:hypothetical protein